VHNGTVFETLSDRLQSIDFHVDGQAPSPVVVESLFRVSFRTLAPTPPLALSPRVCEEHLATALVSSRQAIESRQAFFDAGDKFATLTLSLIGDTSAAALLESEAKAMSQRHEISKTAVTAEAATVAHGHAGGDYVLTGPESLSQAEQVSIIGDVLGRRIKFEELSPDEFRSETEGSWPRPIVDMLLAAWGATIGRPAFITSTVFDILGSAPRSFRQWVTDHATAFMEGPTPSSRPSPPRPHG